MKNAKLSRIIERSQNEQTDQLYVPLRTALSKSLSKQKNLSRITDRKTMAELKNSRVSQKLRQLTPEEAMKMQNSIYIPTNRKLMPTNDMKQIEGKRFSALDVSVNYKKPISENQLRKRIKSQGHKVEETVYILSSNPNSIQNSKKQSPKIKTNYFVSNQNPLNSGKLQSTGPQATPPRLKSQVFSEDKGQVYAKVDHEENMGKQLYGKYGGVSQSSHTTRSNRTKSTYKYNLFSSLDEQVNTKCGTCVTQNQIIASKPTNEPWS